MDSSDTVADHWLLNTCSLKFDQSDEGMAEGLAKKKRIRAGHKSSATRILGQLDDLLGAADPTSTVDMAKLTKLKLSLQEKLDTLKRFDKNYQTPRGR